MKKRVWVKVKERWGCRYHPPRQRRRRKPGRRREGEVGEACEASAALDEQAREAPWVKCISDSKWVCKGCVGRFARGSNPVLRTVPKGWCMEEEVGEKETVWMISLYSNKGFVFFSLLFCFLSRFCCRHCCVQHQRGVHHNELCRHAPFAACKAA